MKVPKARKLPSGSWTCQVQVNGQRVSITAETEKEAVAKAMAVKAELAEAEASPAKITLGAAIDRYIESKDSVLSPSTILGYKQIRSHAFPELMSVQISKLNQEMIQKAVNRMAKEKSPKTIRNAHGLLAATLQEYRPGLVLKTTLPQKEKYEAHIPNDEEISRIISGCRGHFMELPILLALWLGLRASEIRGLTWDAIDGEYIHIKQAIVQGEAGPTLKKTKTYSGARKIKAPKYIIDLINAQPRKDDFIVHQTGHAMCSAFSRFCEKIDIPHYRFHDLRHASASVALFLGVPDKYSMRRMGHATDNMLKTVYQHTLQEKEDAFANMIDDYFSSKLASDVQHHLHFRLHFPFPTRKIPFLSENMLSSKKTRQALPDKGL